MFNRLKASVLMVGFVCLVIYSSYLAAQSQDSGGGGTANIISGGGGGSASTNQANQAWSGTNVFNGPTTFNGVTFHNNTGTNVFMSPIGVYTNIAAGQGYDLMIDKRAVSGSVDCFISCSSGGNSYLRLGDVAQNKQTAQYQTGVQYQFGPGSAITDFSFVQNNAACIHKFYGGTEAAANLRMSIKKQGTAIGPDGAFFTNIVSATIVADPPSLNTLTTFSTNLAVTGARAGSSPVWVGSDTNSPGIMLDGYCPSNGVIWVNFHNTSAGTIDGTVQTLRVIQTVIE